MNQYSKKSFDNLQIRLGTSYSHKRWRPIQDSLASKVKLCVVVDTLHNKDHSRDLASRVLDLNSPLFHQGYLPFN